MVSETCGDTQGAVSNKSLNPCFSGGWSRSTTGEVFFLLHCQVLILVLVEDGLGEYGETLLHLWRRPVLILVLVEDGPGVVSEVTDTNTGETCLNPCFSGGWSRRTLKGRQVTWLGAVLILVLVEDGLGA